jgi:hypothetical protein
LQLSTGSQESPSGAHAASGACDGEQTGTPAGGR